MGDLVIRNLNQSFARDDGSRLVVLEDVNLDVKDKEFVCILGSSGCGKTTSLRMMAGFEQPTSGEVFIRGENVTGVPAYRRPVNMVFQHYALFPHLSVADNVSYGLRQRSPKPSRAVRQRHARDGFGPVGGAAAADRKLGEHQRHHREDEAGDVEQHERRAAVRAHLVGELPDAAQADRRAYRGQDEAGAPRPGLGCGHA